MIVDVEASTAVRQAEVTAAKRMIERIEQCFALYPERLAGDAAYGSAEMLGWLVHERGIEPHVPVFDKSKRTDGTFSREDFIYDHQGDVYVCPAGKMLICKGTVVNDNQLLYRASKYDCEVCRLKPRCCPKEPVRKVPRSLFEGARDMARHIGQTDAGRASRRQRKKVEILFAHLKRILRLDRLRLRGPNGARDEFLLAATVQNLRKLAKLVPQPTPAGASREPPPQRRHSPHTLQRSARVQPLRPSSFSTESVTTSRSTRGHRRSALRPTAVVARPSVWSEPYFSRPEAGPRRAEVSRDC